MLPLVALVAVFLLCAMEIRGTERTIQGSMQAEDTVITGDWEMPWMNGRSRTAADGEPDVKVTKEANWTDIEEGYAELTIREIDTSEATNLPVDYIFILDRTRTMSLNESTFEGKSGAVSFQLSNSPCINPEHYYYKGGISLHLKDYYTGYDYANQVWYEDLPGDAQFWYHHYNAQGQAILPMYENGCYDRLSMAKQAIYELVDSVADQNAQTPANALKSRIAFWSFGDSYFQVTGDKREQGLYNYTPLTSDYEQVKAAVEEVKTYSGTYYLRSLQEAYDILTARNEQDEQYKNIHTKVIFLSDGECKDQVEESKEMAAKIKSLPNTELFTLAVGMTSDSQGAKLLREMASGDAYTASFWQNLSFSGEEGSVLAQTLLNIHQKPVEIRAVNKVLTDQIETEYWEPVEVLSAAGGLEKAQLDPNTGRLIWQIPEGSGTVYECMVKLKLKDQYRYLLAEDEYPTNRDQEGATAQEIAADATKAGAVLDYTISGGIYHTQTRKVGTPTPKLLYGTVAVTGTKHWTVEGSRAEEVKITLWQNWPVERRRVQAGAVRLKEAENWGFAFSVRTSPEGGTWPLVKYDEQGRRISYQVTEETPAYYESLESIVTESTENAAGGLLIDTQLYNEPYKRKVQIQKVDAETKNPLSGAEFAVYVWSEKEQEYVPYKGTTDADAEPYETGSMTGAKAAMKLTEVSKGIYESTSWLYYSRDNQGKFRVIETKAPKGYTKAEKATYDVIISADASEHGSTFVISNDQEGTFENQRIKGSVTFTKKDLENGTTEAQGDAALEGAVYGLYAAEDIVHADGTTGILYQKDDPITMRLTSAQKGENAYIWDLAGKDKLTVGNGLKMALEGLETGKYYLKEESAGEGYLINPEKHYFEIRYEEEVAGTVELGDRSVYNRVKKQAITFHKTTEDSQPLPGAQFSVYLLSEFADGKYAGLSDEEIPRAIQEDYRDPRTFSYENLRDRNQNTACADVKSDTAGLVSIPALPYGRYLIVETGSPEHVLPSLPFVIQIEGDDADEAVDGDGKGTELDDSLTIVNQQILSRIRIEKADYASGEVIQKPGAAYVIRDVEGAWLTCCTKGMSVEEKTAYKENYAGLVVQSDQGEILGTRGNPFVTKAAAGDDETSEIYAELPLNLPVGTYELEEVTAPEGYVLQGHEGVIRKDETLSVGNRTFYESRETGVWESMPKKAVRFTVGLDTCIYDPDTESFSLTITQANDPAVGKISVCAEMEELVSAEPDEDKQYVFTYESRPTAGAQFEIRAAEDIYSPEGENTGKKLFSKGDLVDTLVTDEDGQAWTGQIDWENTDIAKGLPLGKYTITQIAAGDGEAIKARNQASREIEITYAGQEVPVIYRDTVYTSPCEKMQIDITKVDAETGEPLEGAVFGLYAKNRILDTKGKMLAEADTLLRRAETDEAGKADFGSDLPLAAYYVKELESPDGYTMENEEAVEVNPEEWETLQVSLEFKNVRVEEPQIMEETPVQQVHTTETGDALWSAMIGYGLLLLAAVAAAGKGIRKYRTKMSVNKS